MLESRAVFIQQAVNDYQEQFRSSGNAESARDDVVQSLSNNAWRYGDISAEEAERLASDAIRIYSIKAGQIPHDKAREATVEQLLSPGHEVAPELEPFASTSELEIWKATRDLIMEGGFSTSDREMLLERLGPEPFQGSVTLEDSMENEANGHIQEYYTKDGQPSSEIHQYFIKDGEPVGHAQKTETRQYFIKDGHLSNEIGEYILGDSNDVAIEDPSLYERHMHLYVDYEKDLEEYERSLMPPEPDPIDTSNDIPGEPGYGTGGECYRNEAGQLDRDLKEGPARIVSFDEGFDDYERSETTSYYVQAGELVAVCKENYIGDCEGYNEKTEWFNAAGERHREDGPAYEYTSVHNIPEETHLDKKTVQFWQNGVLIESQDRTYEDIISNKPLSVRQAFGYDIDDDGLSL